MPMKLSPAAKAALDPLWRDLSLSQSDIAKRLGWTKAAVSGAGLRHFGRRTPERPGAQGNTAEPPTTETLRLAAELAVLFRDLAMTGLPCPTNGTLAQRARCSAGQIARAVAAGVGAGLFVVEHVGKVRVIRAPDGGWRTATEAPPPPEARGRQPGAEPPPPVARRAIVVTRPPSTCCWPIGEVKTPGFRFCDAPSLPGKPYCGEHARKAYTRTPAEAALPEGAARTRMPRGLGQ